MAEELAAMTMDRMVYEFLSSDGTGDGGTTDMAVNGSVTPVPFYHGPPAGQAWAIKRVIFNVVDDTGANLYPENFGDLAALTNGCLFQGYSSAALVLDFSRGLPIKRNSDFGRFSFDVSYSAGAVGGSGPANGVVQDRFTFTKGGNEILLFGDTSDELRLTVQDNLSTLVEFTCQLQGRRIE